jgi:hypothetical protein
MTSTRTQEHVSTPVGDQGLNIRWDDSAMRSAYANVCNVNGTREEIVLFFGVNQSWTNTSKELVIQLLERIILNPFAAKRLNVLLSRVLKAYEAKYGALPMEAADQARPSEALPTG